MAPTQTDEPLHDVHDGSEFTPAHDSAAPILIVPLTINGAQVRLRVDQWTPSSGSSQWGLLLETMGTNLSDNDTQRVLAAFCGGKPLVVLSTRFKEPSVSAARRVKGEVESGARGAQGPCFNPDEDNIDFQNDDRTTRDDRWLLVWLHMAKHAKASGGEIIQIVDETKGLSNMKNFELGQVAYPCVYICIFVHICCVSGWVSLRIVYRSLHPHATARPRGHTTHVRHVYVCGLCRPHRGEPLLGASPRWRDTFHDHTRTSC